MAYDLLLPEHLTAGARVAGAIAARGAPPLTVAFWFRNRAAWTFAIATPAVESEPTQDVHAAIDAAIATLDGLDPFTALGDAIIAVAPKDAPAPAALAAIDAPPASVVDGVGFNTALRDIAVYDHRARLAARA